MSRPIFSRLAFFLLKRCGYRLADAWDSWRLVLADATQSDAAGTRRLLFEYLLHERLSELLDVHRCDLVVDVGGHVGRFAGKVRRFGYQGPILLVEPIPELAEQLVAAGRTDRDWRVFDCAVGSQAGKRDLNVTEDRSFSSFHQPNARSKSEFGGLSQVSRTVCVDVRRLEELINEHERASRNAPTSLFVKSDTQGFDQEAIESLGRWRSICRAILVEVPVQSIYDGAPALTETIAGYASQGFSLADAFPVSYAKDGSVIELDCLFVSTI